MINDDGAYALGRRQRPPQRRATRCSGRSQLRAGAAGVLRRLLLHAGRPARRRTSTTRSTSRTGPPTSASAARPESTSRARRPGLVPSPEWRNDLYKEGLTDRPWSFGDNVNLAVGQGDLQADPAPDGGRVRRDRERRHRRDPARRACAPRTPPAARSRRSSRAPRRQVDIDPEWQQRDHGRPHGGGDGARGNLVPRLRGRGLPGRRRRQDGHGRDDARATSRGTWRSPRRRIPKVVVAFTFERGGFGADTAAPATQGALDRVRGEVSLGK